jgi:hypothetical protein
LFQRSNRISDLTAAGLVSPEARVIVERAQSFAGNSSKSSTWGDRTFAARNYSASRDQPSSGMFEDHFLGVARHGSHSTTGKPGRFNWRAHPARAG